MTRKELKKLLPVMQAFTEGKIVQYRNCRGEWVETNCPVWSNNTEYRIKPENTGPKYRPFKNNAECWEEMKKHSNFGWVIRSGVFLMVQSIYLDAIHTIEDKHGIDFENAFTELTFTDGAPFGIKEE